MAICIGGMKEDFDLCDEASECKSANCVNGRCVSIDSQVTGRISNTTLVLISFLLAFLIFAIVYVSRVRAA